MQSSEHKVSYSSKMSQGKLRSGPNLLTFVVSEGQVQPSTDHMESTLFAKHWFLKACFFRCYDKVL